MGALVVLAAQAGVVAPGSTGECVVLVRNTGEALDRFDILVHGAAARWARVEPGVLTLEAGEEAPAWVRFSVPRDAGVAAGAVPFVVTVASHNDPDFVHAERGELAVGRCVALRSSLGPVVDEGRTVRTRLDLANDGTDPVDTTVRVSGHPGSERRVRVAAGAEATVELEVRRRRDMTSLVVEVDADSGESFSLAAALTDEGRRLRSDLARSATVFGGLFLAAALGILLLGDDEKSQPTSTAPLAVGSSTSTTVPTVPLGAGQGEGEGLPAEPEPGVDEHQAPAPPPLEMPLLAFVRVYGPGDRDVVVRQPGRGGAEVRLRTPGAVESAPALSPDRAHVAFVQEQGGRWRACVAPATGAGEPTCLFDVASTSSLAWRPDGAALFAVRGTELVEVRLDSSRAQVVETLTLPVQVPGGRFALSPDGTRVVVVSGGELSVASIDGSGGLTIRVPGTPEDPVWTSAGDRIVYVADTHVFVTPVGDGPIRQLTAPRTVNGDATVVDSWVVFRSNRSGSGDLYAVPVDGADKEGAGVSQLTRSPERDIDPSR